ncbi:MAG: response regulator [Saprospiraceae bacterium]|nr:response regulator [Saprospiraceae bacterium]
MKILIIEDDPEIRENLQEILELENYACITAVNGEEAMAIAIQQLPNLILCDIHLPGKNGFEILAEIKSSPSLCRIPFAFLTSSPRNNPLFKSQDLYNADAYLTKPFDVEYLLQEVALLLHPKS